MQMQNKNNVEKILKLLAEQIGVEPDDIKPDDSLLDDLHMSPADLTDFSNKLEGQGFDISSVDLSQITTFGDIVEALGLEMDI